MVGPSSSHTAGAVKIGIKARELYLEMGLGDIKEVDIHFYGSFAKTYKGHATDVATIGGLMGFEPHDLEIKDAYAIAKQRGLEITIIPEHGEIPADERIERGENNPHLNTVKIVFKNKIQNLEITGVSIGGGSYKIIDVYHD